MKLPREQQKDLIEGILPLLLDVFEDTERVRKVVGTTLIYEGVFRDVNGKQIMPGGNYVLTETVRVKVNHKSRIRAIIDRARTMNDMQEDLARYLVKFGESKEAITESIPEHFRTKQQ